MPTNSCGTSWMRRQKVLCLASEPDVIHQIFGGALRRQVKCIECRRESNKFDSILNLSLDVANVGSVVEAIT
ncbi:hypothetical protein BC938DRAFT_483057 [Jimgerdemannia flammicorona]|uniref:USP domain-containing protein n=1 Tax=Jimgerdemannia flammicorona TaxID=994334 RepID=A0A433QCQ3_9FUNG|nr:hypothetical protein BC938DRAFT_483057 [Jimgerdemannia flammicorona]